MSRRSVNGLVTLGLRRRRDEVERWISGGTTEIGSDLDSLQPFVVALRHRRIEGSDVGLPELARMAAAESRRALDQRNIRPPKKRQVVIRPAFATIALLVALLLPGMAFAADGAAPGDLLYPIDQTLELVGIGDGSVDERIEEAATLVRSGDTGRAMVFLSENLEKALAVGDRQGAAMLEETIVVTADIAGSTTANGLDNVADLKEFIEANKGKGVGLDGREFGQAVADIAQANRHENKPDKTGAGQGNPSSSVGTPAGEEGGDPTSGSEDSDGEANTSSSKENNGGNGQGNSGNGNDGQGNSGNGNNGQGKAKANGKA